MFNPVGAVVIVKLEAENILDQVLKPNQTHIASDLRFQAVSLKGKNYTETKYHLYLGKGRGDRSAAKTPATQAEELSSNPRQPCKCQAGVVAPLQPSIRWQRQGISPTN